MDTTILKLDQWMSKRTGMVPLNNLQKGLRIIARSRKPNQTKPLLSVSQIKQSGRKCSVDSTGSWQRQPGVSLNLIEKRWSLSWDLPTLSCVCKELPNLLPILQSLILGGFSNQLNSVLKSIISILRIAGDKLFQRLLIFGKKELLKVVSLSE